MKIFQSHAKNLAILGITAHQSMQRYPFLNARTVVSTVIFILCVIVNAVFLLFVASNFDEYTNSIYVVLTVLIVFNVFVIHIWKMKELFETMKTIENLIQKSKKA